MILDMQWYLAMTISRDFMIEGQYEVIDIITLDQYVCLMAMIQVH